MKLTKKRLMVVIGILVGIPVAAYLLSQFPKFSEGFDGEDKKEDVDTEEGEDVMEEEPMEDDEEVIDEEMEEEPMEDDEEVVDEEMEEDDEEVVDEEMEEDEPKPVEKDQFCFGSFCNVIDDEKEVTPEITMKTALE